LEDLKRALEMLGVQSGDDSITVRTVPDKDWNVTWAASLQPIRLGKRICVRQSWNTVDPGFKGIELIIDPKRAFGTGYHATTQLVIEWLEENIQGGERILDIGTGSGILAMVAIRLGARSALALDNDPVAVECAREYAALNEFGQELELCVKSFEDLDVGRFDRIVANLDGKTMPLLCGLIPGLLNAGGIACLSGLMQKDFAEISECLSKAGLQITARTEREEWLALEVRETNLRYGVAENSEVHGEK
jgi:ribosomal protein L11 methyltransferase